MDKSAFNFNKQILFGEAGAMLTAPSVAYIVSNFTLNTKVISFSGVIGAIIGGAVFWLMTRAYDKNKQKSLSVKSMGDDIAYFTPVAFLITLIFYYPSIFFISNYFLNNGNLIAYSVIVSQLVGLSLFLIFINIYRKLLFRFLGKKL